MTAAMAMPGNTAETFLVHFFGTGLADDRYVVERFQAPGSVQVGLHSLRRESPCQRMKDVDIRHRTNNLHVRNPPGPPLLSACARGLYLYGL